MIFWCICQYYEPFVLGGSVWRWKKFEVEAANSNISITPDLRKQMEQLGDILQFQTVPVSEALKRIAKGR